MLMTYALKVDIMITEATTTSLCLVVEKSGMIQSFNSLSTTCKSSENDQSRGVEGAHILVNQLCHLPGYVSKIGCVATSSGADDEFLLAFVCHKSIPKFFCMGIDTVT